MKSVSSSHTKNETVIICEDDLNIDFVKESIEKTGYKVENEKVFDNYVKKNFFQKLFGK